MWTETAKNSQEFNIWDAELLLSVQITPSVLNKLCNPSPFTATCLSVVSVCSKVKKRGVRVVPAAISQLKKYFGLPIFLLRLVSAPSSSILSVSDLTLLMMIKGRNCLNFLLLSLHFVLALHP